MLALKRDFDVHDEFCDHLLLVDHSRKNKTPSSAPIASFAATPPPSAVVFIRAASMTSRALKPIRGKFSNWAVPVSTLNTAPVP